MRRALLLAALLAVASLPGNFARLTSPHPPPRVVLAAPAASASSATPYDDESQTEALVARAHDLTNLTAIGSAPFRFRASLFFNDPSGDPRIPPARGTYVFTWEAPDKWREDAELLHLKQIEIANGGTLSTKRNAPYPSYSYWWTRNAIAITRGVVYHFDSFTRFEISQIAGRNMVCATNGGTRVQQQLCLDTATALPLAQFDSTLNLQYFFTDWAEWDNRWYPRTIRAFSGKELMLRVEIANVFDAPPESTWIAPPQGATSREWCANMRAPRLSDAIENAAIPDPSAQPGAAPLIGAIVYGVIGKDGSWLDLSVLESPDFKAAYLMLERLRQYRNQPANCHGAPVESEMIFRISPPPR
ncbi:MAG: hypothetical protein WB987_00375 [Candidatus Acidiferrales bacterium]